jgi:hypothetical protein
MYLLLFLFLCPLSSTVFYCSTLLLITESMVAEIKGCLFRHAPLLSSDFLFLGGLHWSGAVGCCRPSLSFIHTGPEPCGQGNMSNNCRPFHHCLCRLSVMIHKFSDFHRKIRQNPAGFHQICEPAQGRNRDFDA